MNTLEIYLEETKTQNRLAKMLFGDDGIPSIDVMKKITLALLLLGLSTGCSTLAGTQQTAEMEFCWERQMNFTWIDEYDAGCIEPIANSIPIRISKIRWLEDNNLDYAIMTRLTANAHRSSLR